MRGQPELPAAHSPAWVVQSWVSFAVSTLATALGIYCLPDGGWVKGFLAMGLLGQPAPPLPPVLGEIDKAVERIRRGHGPVTPNGFRARIISGRALADR